MVTKVPFSVHRLIFNKTWRGPSTKGGHCDTLQSFPGSTKTQKNNAKKEKTMGVALFNGKMHKIHFLLLLKANARNFYTFSYIKAGHQKHVQLYFATQSGHLSASENAKKRRL